MPLYLRLAWRNIWRHRRRTLIVVLSIGLTLAMMMMYDGLIVGFQQAIYGNAIKVLGGNVQVHAAGYQAKADELPLLPLADDQAVLAAAGSQPQVLAAARRINTGGLASNRKGAFALQIVGIEPERERPVSLIAQHVVAGRDLAADDQDVVLIGRGLALAMEVSVGDRFTLAGRDVHQQVRQRSVTVVGIYDVGLPDIERRTAYMALGEAQALYGLPGQCTEVALSLQRLGQEPGVMRALGARLRGYEIASWATNFPELEQAIGTKGKVMDVFSVIILVIVGIGIMNLLLMAVYERTREIGVLGALGLRPWHISLLFLLEGALMSLVGVALGVVLGLATNGILGRVGIDYSQYASLSSYTALISGRVYSTLGLEKILMRTLTVVIIAVLASLYPAREAAQREPASALHTV
jgi:ABC-type lipoprotein release transport system permease subunit